MYIDSQISALALSKQLHCIYSVKVVITVFKLVALIASASARCALLLQMLCTAWSVCLFASHDHDLA